MMEWDLFANRVGAALSLRTVRTADAINSDLRSGAGEMHDLRTDPNELRNVFHAIRTTPNCGKCLKGICTQDRMILTNWSTSLTRIVYD